MEKEEESWHPTERRNVRGCHFVVDIDAKVQQYLEELRANNNDSNDDTMSDRSSTLSRFTVRGPGQTARDPLQFVSTNHGEKIAEEAKQQVTVIEHQKNLRDKVVLPKFSDDAEPWQSDLDTWRRKRLEQVNSPKKEEVIFPIIKETNNNGYSKSSYSKEKEEILRIASPQTDEHNDSGIENRTSNSPSTSADFSPRSADLISPKSYDEAPNTPPPPPPPQSESAKLDQVLIPLSLESQSSGHVTATRIIRQNSDEDEYYPQISRSRQKSQVQTPYMTYLSHSTSSPHVPATTNGSSRVAKLTTSGTVYRAVDIPFDEKPASYVVKKDDNSYRIHMEMGAQPVHKGWGMTVGNRSGHPTIESVIVGSPADQAGILVGDRILSIEGESVADKYPSAINKQLQAAARIGEIDIKIQRPVRSSSMSALHKDVVSSPTFNKARSIFSETKSTDSYSEFKKRHSRGSRESERNEESSRSSARDYNSLPRNANIRDHSGTSYRNTYESLPRNTQDYRVTSIHDKPTPGKLTDFVPEVERNFRGQSSHRDESLSRRQNGGSDEPRVVRNYDLPPQQPKVTTATINLENSRPNDEYVSSVLTRSTLPRNKQPPEDQYIYDDDTVPGKPLLENRDWREVIREQRQPSPGMTADRHRISQQAASLHNLPTYINRRLEESRNAEREVDGRSYESRSLDRRNETSHSHSPAERYEKTEYSRYEKHYSPNYSTTVNVPGQRTTATYEREVDSHRQHSAEQTPIISSYSNYRNQFKQDEKSYSKSASDQKSTNFIDESARKDGVVAVSGKHKCAHCGDELGRGAAMIIESLNLFYHLGCFKCYVCKTSLGKIAIDLLGSL
ncbi:hypothetical protein WR25_11394 isoform A [Diploscapter pachys]|uniref:PDZ domain-containing protein n=1 Tax=Diploscapter pachys TaxID=2018661 RepID=A0A2A2L2Q0_9BILA|nr:hypothetical protein WR25_11394 isoform A [Diploscapter pachys]